MNQENWSIVLLELFVFLTEVTDIHSMWLGGENLVNIVTALKK
jgi:hypothetical protein